MRILIDISPVIYGTGVSVYTNKLVENLLKIDKENEYVLFGGSLRRMGELRDYIKRYRGETNGDKVKSRVYPIPPTLANILFNYLRFPSIETFSGKGDVFHSSDWTQPKSRAFKVTTVHDLIPLKYPKMSDPRIISTHKIRFNRVKDEVDRIIVPSKTTADDVKSLGISKDRIRIIPEAPDRMFKRSKNEKVELIKKKYRINGKYILAVGVSPRKNIKGVVKAHELISTELSVKLVVVGHPYVDIKPKRGVLYLGHVEQVDMPSLFSGAEVFVYPSLYEGYGLPILEAYSCKVPVVTSNLGSMAEVAEKGAILVNPLKPESIAEGILKAVNDRVELIKKSSEVVKKYSWEKTAELTLQVYRESGL